MGVVSLSFRTPPNKDGNGMPLPVHQIYPKMRGRRAATDRQLLKDLDEALEMLVDVECNFWACDGPNRPRNMVTCGRCWAFRKLATVRESIALRLGVPPLNTPSGRG